MHLINNKEYSKEDFEKRLRFETEPVKRVTPVLQQVAVDLLEEMYNLNAIGLAANQVGLRMRLCSIDPAFMQNKKMPVIMFNPEVVECGEEFFTSPEGCLSLPGLGLKVPRIRNVKVKFLGLDGKEYTIEDDNSLLSAVIQHEIDHLDGFLMTDRSLEKIEINYNTEV
ncbi:MAG: peptide deformylase [Candidatus Altiarchaeales archaeon]|nr:peptide deformylase [Candidatus Altiarchaeales archaeon]